LWLWLWLWLGLGLVLRWLPRLRRWKGKTAAAGEIRHGICACCRLPIVYQGRIVQRKGRVARISLVRAIIVGWMLTDRQRIARVSIEAWRWQVVGLVILHPGNFSLGFGLVCFHYRFLVAIAVAAVVLPFLFTNSRRIAAVDVCF
jgi:hypothetical protein